MRHAFCASSKRSCFWIFLLGFFFKWENVWQMCNNTKFFKYGIYLQMFFFNLVERKVCLFTNKQEFLTLHLWSFRQFQNLSEETWNRATENLTELCFVAFLSNMSKKCFKVFWIIFPSSEIITVSIFYCIVWTFWQQTLKSQWTEIWC